jgi:2-iminobutanoate/2-iminopropanoate deaminase
MTQQVQTDEAPSFEALGLPISQARVHDGTVYVSGQVGIDPETGELVDGGVRDQTKQTLANIEAILKAAGASVEDIVKATVFVEDMDDIGAVNEEYEVFITEPYPARSAVEVSELALKCEVEIEVTAGL